MAQHPLTFDTFVTGPSNEFAHQMAKRAAAGENMGQNPIILHAPYGFGKTHLLSATKEEAERLFPERRALYFTAERFLTGFEQHRREASLPTFYKELRAADLLLIDDVHRVALKSVERPELLEMLITVVSDGCERVLLSSEREPRELFEIDSRLRSYLASGVVCGIDPAPLSLRVAILERKLLVLASQGAEPVTVSLEVLRFLAERFTDSIRELEGALLTLVARIAGREVALTVEEAQAFLRQHIGLSERRVTVDHIQKVVCEHYQLKQADLISERRARAVARPRQVAMWIAKQITTRSLPDIGRRFGGRDHTTVLHAVRRIEGLKEEDAGLNRDLEVLLRKVRA